MKVTLSVEITLHADDLAHAERIIDALIPAGCEGVDREELDFDGEAEWTILPPSGGRSERVSGGDR